MSDLFHGDQVTEFKNKILKELLEVHLDFLKQMLAGENML